MDVLSLLLKGFSVALTPQNLLLCAGGVIMGTLVGALPGIGPTGAVAMLLPATFKMHPAGALIMLAGIYYGTQYGGTITSVLMGVPGESASVVTAMDGYQMAKKGRAGAALGIAAIGSFVGGTLSVLGLMLVGPKLASFALMFGPTQYFALMMMAFSLVTAFTGKSTTRGLISLAIGIFLSLVGQDVMTGAERFTFGQVALIDGIKFLPVGVGMFGLAEILEGFEEEESSDMIEADLHWRKVLPSKAEMKECAGPIARGTLIGFLSGLLPGVGATICSFLSYGVEQRISKKPEEFGKGSPAGVAAPETANNACTGAAFVPMLSLGIPAGATSAVLLGALIMFGLQPGPLLFQQSPDVVWGLIASMYIGNVMLAVINVACIPAFVWIMDKIKSYLSIVVLLLATFGVYSYQNSIADVFIMIVFAVVGYLMGKVGIPKAPLVLGLLLGGMAESSLRQALTISHGSLSIFFESPITMTFLALAVLSLGAGRLTRGGGKKKKAEA